MNNREFWVTVFVYVLLVGLNSINAQSIELIKDRDNKENVVLKYKFTNIDFIIGSGRSFTHNTPFIFDNCETCFRENQRSEQINDVYLSSSLILHKKNNLAFGLGFTQYGFIEDHYFGEKLFVQSETFEFFSFRFGHGYDLKEGGRFNLIVQNLLNVDVFAGGHIYLINRLNFSYMFTPILKFKVYKNLAISINPFIRHSILPYNNITFDKNYWPYSYGLGFGISYKFDHSNKKLQKSSWRKNSVRI